MYGYEVSKIGQQFVVVNKTKKEVVNPGNVDDGGDGKLWSVCTGEVPRLVPYLVMYPADGNHVVERLAGEPEYAGRWAGDRIAVVPTSSDVVDASAEITDAVRAEFNEWVGEDEFHV